MKFSQKVIKKSSGFVQEGLIFLKITIVKHNGFENRLQKACIKLHFLRKNVDFMHVFSTLGAQC